MQGSGGPPAGAGSVAARSGSHNCNRIVEFRHVARLREASVREPPFSGELRPRGGAPGTGRTRRPGRHEPRDATRGRSRGTRRRIWAPRTPCVTQWSWAKGTPDDDAPGPEAARPARHRGTARRLRDAADCPASGGRASADGSLRGPARTRPAGRHAPAARRPRVGPPGPDGGGIGDLGGGARLRVRSDRHGRRRRHHAHLRRGHRQRPHQRRRRLLRTRRLRPVRGTPRPGRGRGPTRGGPRAAARRRDRAGRAAGGGDRGRARAPGGAPVQPPRAPRAPTARPPRTASSRPASSRRSTPRSAAAPGRTRRSSRW